MFYSLYYLRLTFFFTLISIISSTIIIFILRRRKKNLRSFSVINLITDFHLPQFHVVTIHRSLIITDVIILFVNAVICFFNKHRIFVDNKHTCQNALFLFFSLHYSQFSSRSDFLFIRHKWKKEEKMKVSS